MNPNQVNPAAWQNHEVIFDDGEFSAVWGQYEDNQCLGARWNGDSDEQRGYPGQGAYPLWFVVPDFLALSTLERLNTTSLQQDLRDDNDVPYSTKINKAIREFMNIHSSIAQN